jgi:hypothetical protein
MVFVTVGYDYASQLLSPFHQVAYVRDDQVNSQHILFGEHKSGVDYDDVIGELNGHHVLADFA